MFGADFYRIVKFVFTQMVYSQLFKLWNKNKKTTGKKGGGKLFGHNTPVVYRVRFIDAFALYTTASSSVDGTRPAIPKDSSLDLHRPESWGSPLTNITLEDRGFSSVFIIRRYLAVRTGLAIPKDRSRVYAFFFFHVISG